MSWRHGLFVVLALLLYVLAFVSSNSTAARSLLWFAMIVLITGVLFFVYVLVFAHRRKAQKDWQASKPPYQHRKLNFDETGLTCVTEETSSSASWTAFVDLKEAPELLVLFLQKDSECVLVPKEFIQAPEDWSALRAMVRAKVGHTKSVET